MRRKEVTVNNKVIVVEEKRVKELKEIAELLKGDIESVVGAKNTEDLISTATSVLGDKLTKIFPTLTTDDIEEAYPSELEELVGGFVEVNFIGAKKVIQPLIAVVVKGLSTK